MNVDVRTELNVLHSDGTLILTVGSPENGTKYTQICAERHKKPFLVGDLGTLPTVTEIRDWINDHKISTLNVAGPRESHRPGFVYQTAFEFLTRVFSGG